MALALTTNDEPSWNGARAVSNPSPRCTPRARGSHPGRAK